MIIPLWLSIVILVIVAYLLGSIPSAVWISKRFYGQDIRTLGSHNAGATNMLRTFGRRAALPVYIIDAAKGYVAVALSNLTLLPSLGNMENESESMFYLRLGLSAAAVLGHIFPIFAGFRGGKGVATMAGCMFGIAPSATLLSLAVFIVVLFFSHYVSLGSIIGGVLFPFFIWLCGTESPSKLIFGGLIAIVLVITHRNNIKRLCAGTESKIYFFQWQKPKEEAK